MWVSWNYRKYSIRYKGAISFTNQGQFNPKKYIDGLAKAAVNLGLKIYENTPVVDLEKGKICRVKTREDNIIEAENVIISSHSPWYDGLNFYFAKRICRACLFNGCSFGK